MGHSDRNRRSRYTVTVWCWSADQRCYVAVTRYAMARSLASAKRRADLAMAALPAIATTWELRSYARGAWADVRSDAGALAYHAEQPIAYHASIGERGY